MLDNKAGRWGCSRRKMGRRKLKCQQKKNGWGLEGEVHSQIKKDTGRMDGKLQQCRDIWQPVGDEMEDKIWLKGHAGCCSFLWNQRTLPITQSDVVSPWCSQSSNSREQIPPWQMRHHLTRFHVVQGDDAARLSAICFSAGPWRIKLSACFKNWWKATQTNNTIIYWFLTTGADKH